MNIQHSSEEVILIPVPGVWISPQLIHPPPNANKENSLITFERLKPKKYNSESNDFCIVPVMPAVPPYIDAKFLNDSQNHIEISAPLKGRKSPYSDKSSRGYRSGRRSSVFLCRKVPSGQQISASDWVVAANHLDGSKYVVDFEHGNILIRAKGCGMWIQSDDLPFPAITIQSAKSKYAEEGQTIFEIRGVCFENTSVTEMLSTQQIEDNLRKVGLACGNHSLGFWIYRNLKEDNSPLITKTVSIFETLGDRRLESHLLVGLERLLAKKYDQSFAQRVIDCVLPLYKGMEDKFPSDDYKTYSKTDKIFTVPLHKKVIDGSFFNFDDIDIAGFDEKSLREKGLIPTYEIYEKIKDLDQDFVNLVKLFGHLGFESGKCISVVHRTGYLWGSYVDHQDNEFHCNAHADNLVVLSKEQCLSNKEMPQILAPLDFDMSFKKEQAINFYEQPPEPDPTYVTFNICPEFSNLLTDIGGYFATVEGASTAIEIRPAPPGLLSKVLWLLRDVSCYEYYVGYQKVNQRRCKGNDVSIDDMYKLIEEGLNESINENS